MFNVQIYFETFIIFDIHQLTAFLLLSLALTLKKKNILFIVRKQVQRASWKRQQGNWFFIVYFRFLYIIAPRSDNSQELNSRLTRDIFFRTFLPFQKFPKGILAIFVKEKLYWVEKYANSERRFLKAIITLSEYVSVELKNRWVPNGITESFEFFNRELSNKAAV